MLLLTTILLWLLAVSVPNMWGLAQALDMNSGYHVSSGEVFSNDDININVLTGGTNAGLAGNTTNVVFITNALFKQGGINVVASDVTEAQATSIPPLHLEVTNTTGEYAYVMIGGSHTFLTITGRLVEGSYIRIEGVNFTCADMSRTSSSNFMFLMGEVVLRHVEILLVGNWNNAVNAAVYFLININGCDLTMSHSRVLIDNTTYFYNATTPSNINRLEAGGLAIIGGTVIMEDNATIDLLRTNMTAVFGTNSSYPNVGVSVYLFILSRPGNLTISTSTNTTTRSAITTDYPSQYWVRRKRPLLVSQCMWRFSMGWS
jgi:hypothetical protein